MKHLKHILTGCLLVLIAFPQTSIASERFDRENAEALENALIGITHTRLGPLVEPHGYVIQQEQSKLGWAESNYIGAVTLLGVVPAAKGSLLGYISAKTGALIGGITSSLGGTAIGGALGWLGHKTGAIAGFLGVNVAALGGTEVVADIIEEATVTTPLAILDCNNGLEARCAVYSPVNDHFRIEVEFVLRHQNTNAPVKGNCMIYFQLQVEELKYRIITEYDWCTPADLFPQNEEGIMRVGNSVDFLDRRYGQEYVVLPADALE